MSTDSVGASVFRCFNFLVRELVLRPFLHHIPLSLFLRLSKSRATNGISILKKEIADVRNLLFRVKYLFLSTDTQFWALLLSQGTILVVSASVRDMLGCGTSEVIGRSNRAMVRDSRSGMKERVEAELAKLDMLEVCLFPFRFYPGLPENLPPLALALVRVGGEHGRPTTLSRDDVSRAYGITYGARGAHFLQYTVVRQARGVLDVADRCYLDPTHSPVQ